VKHLAEEAVQLLGHRAADVRLISCAQLAQPLRLDCKQVGHVAKRVRISRSIRLAARKWQQRRAVGLPELFAPSPVLRDSAAVAQARRQRRRRRWWRCSWRRSAGRSAQRCNSELHGGVQQELCDAGGRSLAPRVPKFDGFLVGSAVTVDQSSKRASPAESCSWLPLTDASCGAMTGLASWRSWSASSSSTPAGGYGDGTVHNGRSSRGRSGSDSSLSSRRSCTGGSAGCAGARAAGAGAAHGGGGGSPRNGKLRAAGTPAAACSAAGCMRGGAAASSTCSEPAASPADAACADSGASPFRRRFPANCANSASSSSGTAAAAEAPRGRPPSGAGRVRCCCGPFVQGIADMNGTLTWQLLVSSVVNGSVSTASAQGGRCRSDV